MDITAIIPVYNNEETLENLLSMLVSYPHFSEIIAVNDGSSDRSLEILNKFTQIRIINHQENQGKGAAIVSGWNAARFETIFTIDADLKTYTHDYLNQLLNKQAESGCDMVIAARDRIIPFGWVSGERLYKKQNVVFIKDIARKSGNGIEQVINHAHDHKHVEIIIMKNTGHVLKYQRHLPHKAAWFYLKEGWQLLNTERKLGYPISAQIGKSILNKFV